jgi:hypothetical protein
MDMATNWFQNNLLSMNSKKPQFLQFLTKQHIRFNVQILIPDSIIPNVYSTKFLGITLDHTLSWKSHILDLSSKLNKACYAIRAVKLVMSPKTLKTVYFSYFYFIMSYGVIFWGNWYGSKEIFAIQKRTIRILTNKSKHESCRDLFKQLQILTLPSQYIYSLLVFVVKNKDIFLLNSEIHNINTWYKQDLHLPSTNLTMVQRWVLYSGSRLFNCLPLHTGPVFAHGTTGAKRTVGASPPSIHKKLQKKCKSLQYCDSNEFMDLTVGASCVLMSKAAINNICSNKH